MEGPPLKRKKGGSQTEPSSQYARCSDGQQGGMPPPPRRVYGQDVVTDSQITQIKADVTAETRSVGNVKGAPSLQDSSVPAGFFEDTAQRPLKGDALSKKHGEFDAFMQEMSALGAVKNNRDGTIMEVSEQQQGHPEGDDSVHNSAGDDIDTFEQFVREERMREIREAVQQRNSAVFEQTGNSVLAEVSGVASDNFISVPTISLPPERKSIAESYNEILQQVDDGSSASSSSEEEDDDDWRQKRLR
jgi:hypothetical protein